MNKLLKMKQDKATAIAAARKITDAAATNADGKLSAEQETEYAAAMEGIRSLEASINREEELQAMERTVAPVALPSAATEQDRTHIREHAQPKDNKLAFGSFAEQLGAIVAAGSPGGRVDPRLQVGAIAGASESVPSDGGFLVQSDFSTEILKRVYETGQISSRVTRQPIGANSNGLKINAVDESSRATGSRYGGIQMYWEGEGDSPNAKKPKFRQMELKLKKLIGLMYATDELLQDSTAFSAVATQAFAEEVDFMVEQAIINGTGAGQPLGYRQSDALIAVAKESGQAANTVVAANIYKMYSRMWSRSRANAVWLINQDIEPQLAQLKLEGSAGGVYPLYVPPTGISGSPYATLMGRPVVPIEHAETLGTEGDIQLVDLSQYLLIDKGAPQQASSIHVRFIYDETAFRITYRVDGQPIWNKTLTPNKGSNTLSPYISLATRA